MTLTIGMAVYNDFKSLWHTVQANRLHHSNVDEWIVVDNCPESIEGHRTKRFCERIGIRYEPFTETRGTAAPRDHLFRVATGDIVCCIDSHVHLADGFVAALKHYYRRPGGERDLVQGPMLYDPYVTHEGYPDITTHFEPVWRDHMWGIWGTNPRGFSTLAPEFDIPMMGLGQFAMLRESWPGFNPRFRQFGGEEGYLHEKVRQRGGRTVCLPALRWAHLMADPAAKKEFPLSCEGKVWNYLVGFMELGLDTEPIRKHFVDGDGMAPMLGRCPAPVYAMLEAEAKSDRVPECVEPFPCNLRMMQQAHREVQLEAEVSRDSLTGRERVTEDQRLERIEHCRTCDRCESMECMADSEKPVAIKAAYAHEFCPEGLW